MPSVDTERIVFRALAPPFLVDGITPRWRLKNGRAAEWKHLHPFKVIGTRKAQTAVLHREDFFTKDSVTMNDQQCKYCTAAGRSGKERLKNFCCQVPPHTIRTVDVRSSYSQFRVIRGCHVKGVRVQIRFIHLLETEFLLILQY